MTSHQANLFGNGDVERATARFREVVASMLGAEKASIHVVVEVVPHGFGARGFIGGESFAITFRPSIDEAARDAFLQVRGDNR